MPVVNRVPINSNNDDDHCEALVEREEKADRNYDTLRNYNSTLRGSAVVVQWGYGTM